MEIKLSKSWCIFCVCSFKKLNIHWPEFKKWLLWEMSHFRIFSENSFGSAGERSQACTRRGLENFKVWEKETENAVFLRRLFFWKKFLLNCWLLVSRLGLTQSIIFYFQDQSEDCLYLNIYTPTNSAFAKGKSSPFFEKKNALLML